MGFRDEIKAVLAIEKEGRRRLEEAREKGEEILHAAREEAEEIRRQTVEILSEERAALDAETAAELGAQIEALEEEERLQTKALRTMADRNREAALQRVLAWLWVEP